MEGSLGSCLCLAYTHTNGLAYVVFIRGIHSPVNAVRNHQGISENQRDRIQRGRAYSTADFGVATDTQDNCGALVYRSFTALCASIRLSIFNSTEVFTAIDEIWHDLLTHTHIWIGYASEMIYKVIEEYPEYAFVVRFKLAEMQILPDLITRLTVVYCRDTVSGGVFR